MKLSFTWSARREGNSGYVLEQSSSGLKREYGPMPSHVVPAFVEARRRVVALAAQQAGASYVEPPDFQWLTDPNAPTTKRQQ